MVVLYFKTHIGFRRSLPHLGSVCWHLESEKNKLKKESKKVKKGIDKTK